MASASLGGGIWAMHFVAMLGLQLPVLFYYDAAITLVSALTAILIVGGALILLHFAERTPLTISVAGGVVGIGILVMHYIGMAGLELCRAIYTPLGIGVSSIVAIGLCILAFWIAYGDRTNRNIVLGTLCFAIAVCSVHFFAMARTSFVAVPSGAEFGPSMSNETLALGVIFSSFVIFGACMWVSVTYLVAPIRTRWQESLHFARRGFVCPRGRSLHPSLHRHRPAVLCMARHRSEQAASAGWLSTNASQLFGEP